MSAKTSENLIKTTKPLLKPLKRPTVKIKIKINFFNNLDIPNKNVEKKYDFAALETNLNLKAAEHADEE